MEKRKAPKLELYYSKEKNLKRVRGHETRCKNLKSIWDSTFEIDEQLPPISVVDVAQQRASEGFHKYSPPTYPFVVEITDMPVAAKQRANIVINYNLWAGEEHSPVWDDGTFFMLGEEYFFSDKDLFSRGRGCSRKGSVVIAPGGNKDEFYRRVQIDCLVQAIGVSEFVLAHSLDRGTFLTELEFADVIITTPSTACMEAFALGKPVLLIQTSDDQDGQVVVNRGFAEWYDISLLELMLRNRKVREAMIPPPICDNGFAVVENIYESWSIWREAHES